MTLKNSKLKIEHTGIRCLVCEDIIFSEYRHDFKACTCGHCFIDGGKDYLRYGFIDKEFIRFVDIYEDGSLNEVND